MLFTLWTRLSYDSYKPKFSFISLYVKILSSRDFSKLRARSLSSKMLRKEPMGGRISGETDLEGEEMLSCLVTRHLGRIRRRNSTTVSFVGSHQLVRCFCGVVGVGVRVEVGLGKPWTAGGPSHEQGALALSLSRSKLGCEKSKKSNTALRLRSKCQTRSACTNVGLLREANFALGCICKLII